MTPGKHWVEICSDRELYRFAGNFTPEEVGLVLETGYHPIYGNSQVHVLSSSGIIGWICTAHVEVIA